MVHACFPLITASPSCCLNLKYLLYATLSAFGIVFISLAIFNTLQLRRRIVPAPIIRA